MTHVARGLDSEGVLQLDLVINGFVPPSLSSSHVSLQVCSLPLVHSGFIRPQTDLPTFLAYSSSSLSDLISLMPCRNLMSHTYRQAKGSCIHGHRRPTREEEST